MKSIAAAVAFLTRIPLGRLVTFGQHDVARSAGWFPLVGILLGGIYSVVAAVLRMHLPLTVVAVLLVILEALATGALHYDGLADSADGFGGGKTREDVLGIMRDHAVGSYGGLALVASVALKAAAYAALLNQRDWKAAMILAPAMGRWAILLLTAALPYARKSGAVPEGMGKCSLPLGTVVIALALLAAMSVRACLALGSTFAVTALFGLYCRRRIGGITGDTLGANVQLCECAALITFLWAGLPR